MKQQLLKEKVYDAIFLDIIEGIYRPNEIINEKQLIERYGTSKSPVRDALMQLCSEGVLLSHPRYGYEVVKIDEKEIYDIIQFRILLEENNLRRSYPRMSKEDVIDLRQYTLKYCCRKEEKISVRQHWDNNERFHLKLMEFGDNQFFYQEVHKAIRTMARAYAQKYWERFGISSMQLGCDRHLALIEELENNDLEEAVNLLKEDISSFYDLFKISYLNECAD